MTINLVLVLLLLAPLLIQADISPDYLNYFETATTCGMSPLNARVNQSLLPIGSSAPYILNGYEAHYGEWPFIAWVKIDGGNCNGVIVSSEVVVTAGHCIERLGYMRPGLMNDVYGSVAERTFVLVGKNNRFTTDEFEVKHHIKTVQSGAYYKQRGFIEPNPDFARLWLRKPIKFNDYVLPVCISSRPDVVYTLMRGPLFFIGNGANAGERLDPRFPRKMQWLEMKARDPQFTSLISTKENSSETQFDASDDSKFRKLCPGDSGGPLVALDENKHWSLVGIAIKSPGPCYKEKIYGIKNTFVVMPKILGIFDENFKPGPNEDAKLDAAPDEAAH